MSRHGRETKRSMRRESQRKAHRSGTVLTGELLSKEKYITLCNRFGGNPKRRGRQIVRRQAVFAELARWGGR